MEKTQLAKLREIANSLLDLVTALEEEPEISVLDLKAECTALMAQNGWSKEQVRNYVRQVYKKTAVDLTIQEWRELNLYLKLHTPDHKRISG